MTAADRWLRAKEIFNEALEAPTAARRGLVRDRAGTDASLAREVEDLLSLHSESGLALDEPPSMPRYQKLREGDLLAARYRIEGRLGGGGMGEVYRAFDIESGQAVAIKTIRPFLVDAARAEERFLREVEMARRIDHPNVCRMLALDEHAGERFCVMELLEGETLASHLTRSGPMTAADALPIVTGICAGLAAAHAAGVIHRDLKPANIVLCNGRAVIIDFGLAAGLAKDRGITAEGDVIGTLAYMAPEQLAEGIASPASDLYALGVILYEMLTGRKPHGGDGSPLRLVARRAARARRPLPLGGLDVPRVWSEVIDRCLRADPGERIPDTLQVQRMLVRGRASLGHCVRLPHVWIPALAMLSLTAAAIGWTWLRTDYVPRESARALFEQGQSALAESAPLRAARLLEQAVDADPAFIEARALLAACLAELDQPEGAREAVLRADEAAEQRFALGAGEQASLRAARAAVIRDHARTANQYTILAGLARGSRRAFALVAAARAMELAGRRDEAIRTLESAVQADPVNPAARVRLGVLLSGVRQIERAREQFRIAESMFEQGGNPEGLSDLLLARSAAAGDPAERQRDLDRVLALSEKTGNRYHALGARFRLAAAAVERRDYDTAVRMAGDAAEQARKEGMPVVAANALGELGYTFLYMKRPEQGVAILREAVELAGRANATGLLAANRMRLGEVLGALWYVDEAMAAMEPAVEWMRKSGSREKLPLVLIKWGTLLGMTARLDEAAKAYADALELARADGNNLYESMALDRLGGFHDERNLAKAADYREESVPLGRQAGLTRVFFQTARTISALGRFDRAEQLVREGERESARYPAGPDRTEFDALAAGTRARVAYRAGDCPAAMRFSAEAMRHTPSREREAHAISACSSDPAILRRSLAWFSAHPAFAGPAPAILNLRLHRWATARQLAAAGLAETSTRRQDASALEFLLVLRAAERALGHANEATRWESRAMDTARRLGFDPPESFAGRRDLAALWNSAAAVR